MGGTNKLGDWRGRVTNHTTNVGGLILSNYANGSTRTGQLTLSAAGNFNMGGGSDFQDTYKLQVTGNSNFVGSVYRIPQQAFYNFGKTSVSNNLFGKGNRFVGTSSIRETGTSFSSHSNGSITFSQNGYYRIRVGGNPVTDGYNDRLAFCLYLLIDGTDYFQNQNYNFQGYTYTRNSSDGAFGNINFEDYIYIASGDVLQVRHKLDTNNRNFDDQLNNTQMECYCNLQIERIAEAIS